MPSTPVTHITSQRVFTPCRVDGLRKTVAAILLLAIFAAATVDLQANLAGTSLYDQSVDAPSAVTEFAKLDKSFNGTGLRTDNFGNGRDSLGGAALQPDGKIVVAGSSGRVYSGSESIYDMVVARFNTDGTLDETFGTACRKQGSPPLVNYGASAAAVQADGKILVAGTYSHPNGTGIGTANSMYVLRCNADGSIDTTMSANLGRFGSASSLAIQPDGKIVTVGTSQLSITSPQSLAVVRFNTNGSLDTSFDSDGILTMPGVVGLATVVQADGKILVGGAGLHRYNANGSLDTSFHFDGTAASSGTTIYSLAIQPDGKIVGGGSGSVGTTDDFSVVRYNTDGTLDTSFDTDGEVKTPILSGHDRLRSVVIQPDGKIAVGGYVDNGVNSDFALVRYNTDGSLDTSLDTDGKVTTPFLGEDNASELLLRPDGRMIAAGTTETGTVSDFALAGYNTDGSLDASFGVGGKVITDYGGQSAGANSVAIQSDGKIVVAGSAGNGSNSDFAVTRYNPDGTLDTGFGAGGKVMTPILSLDDVITSVAIQGNGKILAAGIAITSTDANSGDFALVRYNPDGSLDTSFDGDGKVTTPIGNGDDRAYGIVIQPDGKIVLAGDASMPGTERDFALVRFNVDGSLDSTFDSDGKVSTHMGSHNDRVAAVALQPDGKIIVGGDDNVDFAIARYNSDGSLDTSFDGDGKVTTPILTLTDQIFSLAIQPDGKIVAGGAASGPANPDFALARYNNDGSLDTSFDGDGKVTTPILTSTDRIGTIKLLADGRIVAGGSADLSGGSVLAFARYNSNGSLDQTFDSDGKVTFAGANGASGMALDAQNRIVGVGGNGSLINGIGAFVTVRIALNTSVPFDFDGDGRSDYSIWRPSNFNWYLQSTVAYSVRQWGAENDKLAPADYDGDGKTDLAIFRPSNTSWYIILSESSTFQLFSFGQADDLPMPMDRNSDGIDEAAVYRPSTALFYLRAANGNVNTLGNSAAVGDKPIRGDFDGDGIDDLATYSPGFVWKVNNSSANDVLLGWGQPGDIPVPGDYDGDRKADITVFRPSTGEWFRQRSSAGLDVITWGVQGDIPVPADYDGDGTTDVAIFRPSNSTWYIIHSTTHYMIIRPFGATGDLPIPAAYSY